MMSQSSHSTSSASAWLDSTPSTALAALLDRHRAAELDASYAAYDKQPLDQQDEWGDLASGRRRLVTDLPARGEVWWCELPDIGRRPVVVLSRNAAIPRLGRALVAPCTTAIRELDSEVRLEPGDDPGPRPCAVNLDSVESVPTGVLVERLGRLPISACRKSVALAVAVDCQA